MIKMEEKRVSEVEDQGALQEYLTKRHEWLSWYNTDISEPHAIETQIHLMLLSEMSARVLIEERKHSTVGDLALVPVLTYLIDSGYFASQLLAIRRLFDPRQDVISLRRAFEDVRSHRYLLTREIFVSFDGTSYDPSYPGLGISGLQPEDSPFSDYTRSLQKHKRFDLLSRTDEEHRSRFDRVHDQVFFRLDRWINDGLAKRLIQLSHTYLAHAADPKSRKKAELTGLSFTEVEAVQRIIVIAARGLFDIILSRGVHSEVVPMTQLGFFGKVWDGNSMVVSTSRMNEHWEQMARARNEWPANLEHELCK